MEPTGFPRPLRTINVPVIKVAVTAPKPTHMIPTLPSAGFTLFSFILLLLYLCCFCTIHYHSRPSAEKSSFSLTLSGMVSSYCLGVHPSPLNHIVWHPALIAGWISL